MLRLWSQIARPQLSCNCTDCSTAITGVLARRTASATTRRRVKLVDAFTILLAPVFATAFVADATRKDRRRIEWDKKIAEVEGEVERLHREESRILRSLNSRVNAPQKRPIHTRSYSTEVRSRPVADEGYQEDNEPLWRSRESEVGEDDGPYQISAGDEQEKFATGHAVAEETGDAVRRIEKLVALKLAMRIMVHLNVGKSPRFNNANPSYTYGPAKPPEDLNHLINQLRFVTQSLGKLNAAGERPNVPPFEKMPRKEQAAIDRDIRQAILEFQNGHSSVRGFVKRIGNSIIRSSEPPSVAAYVPLMAAFSRARLDELAYLVMTAIDEGRLALSNTALFNIIRLYGKNQDAHRFDRFLKSVVRADAENRYVEPWEWRRINEVDLPCPKSDDSRLLQILVYTALKCDQPHRAEAWASQLDYSETSADHHSSHVLRNFLKFYSAHRDWQRGQTWLSAALAWAILPGPNVIRDLQRVIFAMLELCVACGKQQAYSCILQAAVHAGVGVFKADADLKLPERSKSILAEWAKIENSESAYAKDDHLSPHREAQDFYAMVTPRLEALGLTKRSQSFEWPTPESVKLERLDETLKHPISTGESANEYRDLYEQQAAELERVKAQLVEAKRLLESNARLRIGTHDSQTSDSPRAFAQSLHTSILTESLSSGPSCRAEDSVRLSYQEEILPPSPSVNPLRSSDGGQGIGTASPKVNPLKSDLDQRSILSIAQAPNPGSRSGMISGSEDVVKPCSSGGSYPDATLNSISSSAQGSQRFKPISESLLPEASTYPNNAFPADSIQHSFLSEVPAFVESNTNQGRETERCLERNVDYPGTCTSHSSHEQVTEVPIPGPEVAVSRLDCQAIEEPTMPNVATHNSGDSRAANDATEPQSRAKSNQTEKRQGISPVETPPTRLPSDHFKIRFTNPFRVRFINHNFNLKYSLRLRPERLLFPPGGGAPQDVIRLSFNTVRYAPKSITQPRPERRQVQGQEDVAASRSAQLPMPTAVKVGNREFTPWM